LKTGVGLKQKLFVPSKAWREVRKAGYGSYRIYNKGEVKYVKKKKKKWNKKKKSKGEGQMESVVDEPYVYRKLISDEEFVRRTGTTRRAIWNGNLDDLPERPRGVPSSSAKVLFRLNRDETVFDPLYLFSETTIPMTEGLGYAMVIPSGEGKTELLKESPNKYFDYDMRTLLPVKRELGRRGSAEFYVDNYDWGQIGHKVLLVRTVHMVPKGFKVLGVYALCDCIKKHPHVDGLKLPRGGQLRHNLEDRKLLPKGVICCESFSQRAREMHKACFSSGFEQEYTKRLLAKKKRRELLGDATESSLVGNVTLRVRSSEEALRDVLKKDKAKGKPWYYLL